MFATGSARPDQATKRLAGGGLQPAGLLRKKGGLIEAEERATGALMLLCKAGQQCPTCAQSQRLQTGLKVLKALAWQSKKFK